MILVRRKKLIVIALILPFLLSGCFLNALLSRVTVTSSEAAEEQTDIAISASATVAICEEFGTFIFFDCTYIVEGQEIGSTISLITEFGLIGFIIDPVILQVPVAATNFSGTFTGLSPPAPLDIIEVSGNLAIDVNTNYTVEVGTKLVILDFPDPPPPVNNVAYGYTLNFELPGNVNPVQVKALFAGKVTSNGQTFYPPLLPCESNFANIATINLPQNAFFEGVDLSPLSGAQGCDNVTYNFSAATTGGGAGAQAIPSTTGLGLALLGGLLALFGGCRLRHRKDSSTMK